MTEISWWTHGNLHTKNHWRSYEGAEPGHGPPRFLAKIKSTTMHQLSSPTAAHKMTRSEKFSRPERTRSFPERKNLLIKRVEKLNSRLAVLIYRWNFDISFDGIIYGITPLFHHFHHVLQLMVWWFYHYKSNIKLLLVHWVVSRQ
jgi:hypothetical protein